MGRVLSRLIAPVWQPTAKSLRGWALASVIANAVIISTGEAVRLSSSGLGCPDWPTCTKSSAVAAHSVGQTTLNTWIEFGNRLLNFPLVAIAGLTFIACLRYYQTHGRARKDLVWLSAVLPLGVIAQAVVGGILVLTKLNPALVGRALPAVGGDHPHQRGGPARAGLRAYKPGPRRPPRGRPRRRRSAPTCACSPGCSRESRR